MMQRRKTSFVPDRAYTSFGVLPQVPVTMPAAPWEEAVTVDPSLLPDRVTGQSNGRSQTVTVLGKKFASLNEASRELCVDRRTFIEAVRYNRLDELVANLLKREKCGMRKHRTITALWEAQQATS